MLEIAGGVVLAVMILYILNILLQVVGVVIKPLTPAQAAHVAQRKEKENLIVEEGRQKHMEWEKRHPLAKHLYRYDKDKYLAKHR